MIVVDVSEVLFFSSSVVQETVIGQANQLEGYVKVGVSLAKYFFIVHVKLSNLLMIGVPCPNIIWKRLNAKTIVTKETNTDIMVPRYELRAPLPFIEKAGYSPKESKLLNRLPTFLPKFLIDEFTIEVRLKFIKIND